MSYTPTTWATGDTITATKLNKMEQGIAESGGGSLVFRGIGFGTGSHGFGEVVYATWNGTKWVAEYNTGWPVYFLGEDGGAFRATPMNPIPTDANTKLCWVVYAPLLTGIDVTLSGNISQNSINVYVDGGTYEQNGYEITGAAYLTLNNG